MWNQVGSPSMLEGKTFLPLQGMPIPCRARSNTRLADWLPEPLTVPTRMARSLTEAGAGENSSRSGDASGTERAAVDMACCLAVGGRASRPAPTLEAGVASERAGGPSWGRVDP